MITHTHSGPCITEFVLYDTKNVPGVMPPAEYRPILLDKLKEVAVNAWKNRKSGGISWGLGHAVVGHNRRMGYYDGSAMMYGPTDIEGFMGVEGTCDHGIELLFCWDEARKLTGIVINVACPSQVTEAKYFVTADYWAEVRKQLREKYSEELFILPLCGAAGDQSPRDLPRGYKGEPNMWDEEGMVEIGKRISNAVTEVYEKAKSNIRTKVQFTHTVKNIDLPIWRVTALEIRFPISTIPSSSHMFGSPLYPRGR
ncbi:MAG: hypothetical protein M1426_00635, partial [Patescibacteria group bacterium]|nr:hypothetical protein [Patescibacteria group bacterium]